jgi:hypothetical protein
MLSSESQLPKESKARDQFSLNENFVHFGEDDGDFKHFERDNSDDIVEAGVESYFRRRRHRGPSPDTTGRSRIERTNGYGLSSAGVGNSTGAIHISYENGVPYEVRGQERIALDTRISQMKKSVNRHSTYSGVREIPVRRHHGHPRIVEQEIGGKYPLSGRQQGNSRIFELDSSDEYQVSGT